MAVGDIGHWRDSAGSQLATTTFAGFNFASQQRNDNSTYSKFDDSTIEFEEAGLFCIKWQIVGIDNSNGRFTPQTRAVQAVGSGDFFTTYCSGFSRNNNNDDFGVWGYAFINAVVNDRAQIQWRSGTDVATGGSTINASDVQVVKIGDDGDVDYAIYNSTTSGNAFGGTTPNDVTWQTIVAETDTASIQRAADQTNIDLKRDNARYQICYGMAGDAGNGGTRNQRVGRAVSGSTLIDGSVSYFYERNDANQFTGLGCRLLHEVGVTDEALSFQVYRGDGVLAGEGGGTTDDQWTNHSGEETALLVIDLPDQVEVYAAVDGTAAQDLAGGVDVTINANRTVNFNDAASFTRVNDTEMDCTIAMDVDVWCNFFTAREDVGSGVRLTLGARIEIDGSDQTVGVDKTYTRGDAGGNATFGGAWHPGGYFSVSAGANIECESFDDGDDGAEDTTRANEVGFFAINTDTWEAVDDATTVTPLLGSVTITGYVPNVCALICPAIGTLSIAGEAPSVCALTNPLQGFIQIDGFLPEAQSEVTVLPIEGDLILTGYVPNVEAEVTVTVSPVRGLVTLVGYSPNICALVTPDTADLTVIGLAPNICALSNPLLAGLSITGFQPSIVSDTEALASPVLGELTINGFVPNVCALVTPLDGKTNITGFLPGVCALANPQKESLSIVGYQPVINAGEGTFVVPETGSLSVIGEVPNICAVICPQVATTTITGHVPNVCSVSIPVTADLTITGFQPAVTADTAATAEPAKGELLINGLVPDVQVCVEKNPIVGGLTITGHIPAVVTDLGTTVSPPIGALTIIGYNPLVGTTKTIALEDGQIIIQGYRPNIAVSGIQANWQLKSDQISSWVRK